MERLKTILILAMLTCITTSSAWLVYDKAMEQRWPVPSGEADARACSVECKKGVVQAQGYPVSVGYNGRVLCLCIWGGGAYAWRAAAKAN